MRRFGSAKIIRREWGGKPPLGRLAFWNDGAEALGRSHSDNVRVLSACSDSTRRIRAHHGTRPLGANRNRHRLGAARVGAVLSSVGVARRHVELTSPAAGMGGKRTLEMGWREEARCICRVRNSGLEAIAVAPPRLPLAVRSRHCHLTGVCERCFDLIPTEAALATEHHFDQGRILSRRARRSTITAMGRELHTSGGERG